MKEVNNSTINKINAAENFREIKRAVMFKSS